MASRARWWIFLLLGLACGREVPIYDVEPWAHEPPPIPALAGRIVVANSAEDSLSILDPAMPAAAQRLPIGFNPVDRFRPRRLASDPQGRFLYVLLDLPAPPGESGPHGTHGAMIPPGWITRVDTATVRAAPWVAVDPHPGEVVLSGDGRRLYLTHYDLDRWGHSGHDDPRAGDATLTIIDTDTGGITARVVLCPGPHGLGLSRDERTLYATCVSDELAVVDLAAAPPVVRRVPLPGRDDSLVGDCRECPFALAVAPDGLVWVANRGRFNGANGSGSLMVFDPGAGAFDPGTTVRMLGRGAWVGFATTAASYRAYVIEQGVSESRVHAYAPPAPGAAAAELEALALAPPVCTLAHALAITPDGRHGHLVCEGDHLSAGTLLQLGLEPLAIEGTVPLGLLPEGIALMPPRQ